MVKPNSDVSTAITATNQFQRLEYLDDKSSKFWEIRVSGSDTEVRYGKIGTTGQAQTKSYDSPEAAQKSADKLIAEKIKGGYQQDLPAEVASEPQQVISESASLVKAKRPAVGKVPVQPPALDSATKHEATSSETSRTLCISGKLPSGLRKADYETALRNININLIDDVIAGLSFLVLADPTSTSAKAEKARKQGVQVISEDQLIALTSGEWNGLK